MVVAFGICLGLNLYVVAQIYEIVQTQNTIAEYYKLKTCGEMETRFYIDLKNADLKYFQFGIGTNLELQKTLKSKYGIKSFGMGCLVHPKFKCYNELVNNYLKEIHNDGIVDY